MLYVSIVLFLLPLFSVSFYAKADDLIADMLEEELSDEQLPNQEIRYLFILFKSPESKKAIQAFFCPNTNADQKKDKPSLATKKMCVFLEPLFSANSARDVAIEFPLSKARDISERSLIFEQYQATENDCPRELVEVVSVGTKKETEKVICDALMRVLGQPHPLSLGIPSGKSPLGLPRPSVPFNHIMPTPMRPHMMTPNFNSHSPFPGAPRSKPTDYQPKQLGNKNRMPRR